MSQQTREGRQRDDDSAGRDRAPPLERLIGALGAVLVVALLAFLVYQAVAPPGSGAGLSARVSRIERAGEQFAVHVRVENDGGQTASGVSVAGELSSDGTTIEQATATISYVPSSSSRSAVLVFARDPREAELSMRVAGYEVP